MKKIKLICVVIAFVFLVACSNSEESKYSKICVEKATELTRGVVADVQNDDYRDFYSKGHMEKITNEIEKTNFNNPEEVLIIVPNKNKILKYYEEKENDESMPKISSIIRNKKVHSDILATVINTKANFPELNAMTLFSDRCFYEIDNSEEEMIIILKYSGGFSTYTTFIKVNTTIVEATVKFIKNDASVKYDEIFDEYFGKGNYTMINAT